MRSRAAVATHGPFTTPSLSTRRVACFSPTALLGDAPRSRLRIANPFEPPSNRARAGARPPHPPIESRPGRCKTTPPPDRIATGVVQDHPTPRFDVVVVRFLGVPRYSALRLDAPGVPCTW